MANLLDTLRLVINGAVTEMRVAMRRVWVNSRQHIAADDDSPLNLVEGTNVTLQVGSGGTVIISASQPDISGKADKSAAVSTVAYDTANRKLTKTINGTTTDVVTAETIVVDGNGVTTNADQAITGSKVFKKRIVTAFKESVAPGCYQADANTVPDLFNEVRYSNGAMGSVKITSTYAVNNITVGTAWYNFIYIPHRTGGAEGKANGDNTNYGTLILTAMNTDHGMYIIRFHSGAIGSCRKNGAFADAITSGQVLIADGSNGQIKTSGYTIAKSVPADAKFTDTTYSEQGVSSSVAGLQSVSNNRKIVAENNVGTGTTVNGLQTQHGTKIITIPNGTASQSFTMSAHAYGPNVAKVDIIIDNRNNGRDLTISVPNTGSYVSCDGVTALNIAAGKIGEMNVIYANSKFYIRTIS